MPSRAHRQVAWLVLGALALAWAIHHGRSPLDPTVIAKDLDRTVVAHDGPGMMVVLQRGVMSPRLSSVGRDAVLQGLLPRLWDPPLHTALLHWCDRLEQDQGDSPDGPATAFYRAVLRATPLGPLRSNQSYSESSPALGRAVDYFAIHARVHPLNPGAALPDYRGPQAGPYDASAARGLDVSVRVPAGRMWTVVLSESGWNVPGHHGADDADGERWYLAPRRGTGARTTAHFLFSELRPDVRRGNQHGNDILDTQALARVDLVAAGKPAPVPDAIRFFR